MNIDLEQPKNPVLNLEGVELFEELYTRLTQAGGVRSSGKIYSPERLEADIEEIRETKRLGHNVSLMLRTLPTVVREKVAELLDKKIVEVAPIQQTEEVGVPRSPNNDLEKIEALRRGLGITN